MRVLVVDDEPDLLATLDFNLRREGFDTVLAATGTEALIAARKSPQPNMVVLDLMLPDISGTEVCRQLRTEPRTRDIPVLILSAKGGEVDRVVGFEIGADDYVVKPFSVRELMLRIHAVLRRAQSEGPGDDTVTFGRMRLDLTGHRTWVDDAEITLTALEFRLLSTLLERKGRVQSRDRLLADVWGISANVTTRTVDTHVKRLRDKLSAAGAYIETLRGVGYRFRAEPDGDD